MGKLFACFGGGFKCNRKVESFEKTHAFLASVPGTGPKNSITNPQNFLSSIFFSNTISVYDPQIKKKFTAIQNR